MYNTEDKIKYIAYIQETRSILVFRANTLHSRLLKNCRSRLLNVIYENLDYSTVKVPSRDNGCCEIRGSVWTWGVCVSMCLLDEEEFSSFLTNCQQ